MDPSDPYSISSSTLSGMQIQSAPSGAVNDADLLARALLIHPSKNLDVWTIPPPTQEAAANADPLTQLGLSQLYPDLFGHLGPANLDATGYPEPQSDVSQSGLRVDWQPEPVRTSEQRNGIPADGVAFPPNPDAAPSPRSSTVARQSYPVTAPTNAHLAKAGDNISSIVGSSSPAAVGQFAIQNGLQSSAVYPGQTYVVPDPRQAYDPRAAIVGQAILNRDNARLATAAQQRFWRKATSGEGLWVNGQYYPANQIWAAASALSKSPTPEPRDPSDDFFALQLALQEQQRLSGRPSPESWYHKAQRNFWETVSGHTADNAGDFLGGGLQELWDDLPGLEPALYGLPSLFRGASAGADGLSLGRSGYRSIDEFGDAALKQYQSFYDQHYEDVARLARNPAIPNSSFLIRRRVDGLARQNMREWLRSEGIPEGPGEVVQINRRLYDPAGSGAYRVPDVYIPDANTILDGSLAQKFGSNPQIANFGRFSGGARTTIVRPSSLAPSPEIETGRSGSVVGSYGIIR